VVTFRFLEDFNHLAPDHPWFRRLRDAYLEPWGSGLEETFEIALASAGVRMRRHGPGSGMHSRRRHGPPSTERPRSSCGERSLTRATEKALFIAEP